MAEFVNTSTSDIILPNDRSRAIRPNERVDISKDIAKIPGVAVLIDDASLTDSRAISEQKKAAKAELAEAEDRIAAAEKAEAAAAERIEAAEKAEAKLREAQTAGAAGAS